MIKIDGAVGCRDAIDNEDDEDDDKELAYKLSETRIFIDHKLLDDIKHILLYKDRTVEKLHTPRAESDKGMILHTLCAELG